jgi:hypothetical protein
MKITLAENGMWGGRIPDIIRNDHIILRFENITIEFKEEEFEFVRSLLSVTIQDLYKKTRKLVKEYDNKCDIERKFHEEMEPLLLKIVESSDDFELYDKLVNFHNDFWEDVYKDPLGDIDIHQ